MTRKLLLFLLFVLGFAITRGQADSSHLRISLLTCGPGDDEVYSVFGHSGVRVIDSAAHTDIVFNYGTFEFGPDFELQFMRGKLLYCLSTSPYLNFLQEYVVTRRSVEEQVLLLTSKQKASIYSFLQWNAEPENKSYKYDFFFDNCSTRIRDIFTNPDVFGKGFTYGPTLPPGSSPTFRDIINLYFYKDHWTRTGVNILLGSKIDKRMTGSDIMFLPDYLRDGLGGAVVNGVKAASATEVILPGEKPKSSGLNGALLLTVVLAALTIAGLTVNKLRLLGRVMSVLFLFVTGLLGTLILVMWFATDHQGCGNNFNLLWCLPTNLIIAVANPKGKAKYALVGMILLLVSLILHVLKIQGLIIEFIPVFLALMFIYGTIYRRSIIKPA